MGIEREAKIQKESDHYNAQDMHQALQKKVLESNIENEDVPKISTIQNWIGRYTRFR
ncbi:22966_t:CDS:2 [Gigaspora margarita]|uniref:22966_t:CDS:1 n=1 Tax=Gigaspora margarita TaxID=4874 RepID=A0ABM8W176_GIGMA|nr:22966_t:CDS:2 [Gigaspora margarita]